MPIQSGQVGRYGVKATPDILGPHKGIPWRSPALANAMPTINGRTHDSTGAILGNCSVWAMNTQGDTVMGTTTSDANGLFSLTLYTSGSYYLVAYKTGSSISIPSQLTLSRPSSATYNNSSGVVTTAASDAARFDYTFNGTSWDPAGLLIEEQRTNLCLSSADLTGANWSVNSNSTAASSAIVAPDGSTMTQITYSGVSNTYRGQLISTSFFLGQSLTMAIWLAAGTISQVALGFNGNAVANNISSSLFTLTSTPQRFSFTVTVAQDDSGMYFLLGGGISGGPNLPGTGTIYAWGADMELGAAPSSYIPTTTVAVTRSADVLSSTDATLLAAKGWVVEVGELQASTAATLLGINTVVGIGATSGNALTTADGGAQTTGNTGTWTSQNRGGLAFDATPRVSIALNGGAVVTAGNSPVTPTNLYFGSTNAGASGFINGHIRSIAAFSAQTDGQLQTSSVVGAAVSGTVFSVTWLGASPDVSGTTVNTLIPT